MSDQQAALLVGYGIPATSDNTERRIGNPGGSIMAPLVDAQKKRIERLEARVDALLTERDSLKMRIWDLEDRLYRNSQEAAIRAKFDEESA